MSLISVEGYKKAGVHCLKIKNDELWVNIKHVGDGLGVTNIYIWFSFKRNKRHLWEKKINKKRN